MRGAGLVGLAVLGGCQGNVDMLVECKVEQEVVCTVQHLKGSSPGKACWDVRFTCRNGTVARGNACQVVEPKGSAIVRLQKQEIPGFDKCDLITDYDMENLKISAP